MNQTGKEPDPDGQIRGPFGIRTVAMIASLLTLALGLSAGHTFLTLTGLRQTYLENRARDVVDLVGRGIRGPGRFANEAVWKQAFTEAIDADPESIQFLALADSAGTLSQKTGKESLLESKAFGDLNEEGIRFSLHTLSGRRGGPPWAKQESTAGHQLVVGIATEATQFLMRQAYIHLAVSGTAIIAIWLLTIYLARTLRRLVALRLREEAEKNLANLGRMSATLAHEIRNPLGAMKGLTQVIQEGLPHDHAAQTMISTVINEAERLEHLVNDLLDFARPASASPTQCELGRIAAEVTQLLQSESQEAGVTLRLQPSSATISATLDVHGLKQILLNVIKNAVEATPAGGTVQIQLAVETSKDFCRIEIADQGPGFTALSPEEAFEPFRTTKLRGSGLGLPISRQILSRLGGTIELANGPSGGAVCILRVPLSNSPSNRPSNPAPRGSASR